MSADANLSCFSAVSFFTLSFLKGKGQEKNPPALNWLVDLLSCEPLVQLGLLFGNDLIDTIVVQLLLEDG